MLSLVLTSATDLDPNESIISAPELPASKVGALYMLASKATNALLAGNNVPFELSLFPDHEKLIRNYIGDENMDGIGSEPSAVVDSVLLLGWAALDMNDGFTAPEPDEKFNRYLQRLSLLSATTAFGNLRYQAHYLVSTILHTHKSSSTRLDFIQDTLEHCPYENLKVCAIGWFKDELLAAFGQANAQHTASISEFRTHGDAGTSNVFSEPSALLRVGRDIFSTSETSGEIELISNIPLWLAAINLYFLLFKSPVLYKGLEVAKMCAEVDVEGKFWKPLDEIIKGFNEPRADRFRDFSDGGLFEISLLADSVNRAREAASAMDRET